MTDGKAFLQSLIESHGISGYEYGVAEKVVPVFQEFTPDVHIDRLGNVIAKLSGTGDGPRPRVMLAGHMDEIGMLVTKIDERGFLRFHAFGFDQRTLPSQEVIVHGREPLVGIIGAKPPHLLSAEERTKAIKIENMTIDLGMSVEKVKQLVQVGDPITIRRSMIPLQGNIIAGKALDDRAGVVAIFECFKELQRLHFSADVFGVATVQEEVGLRGAVVSAFGVTPDIGIAIDVCHGDMPGVSEFQTSPLGKGPTVGVGANIHPKVFQRLKEVGKEQRIPFHTHAYPAGTGTDAWAIQVARAGVASAVISLPERYMHTSVETLSYDDIVATGKLLAHFIASLDAAYVEGLSCY